LLEEKMKALDPAKGWYSAQELAGLPGVPGTDRGVKWLAQKNLWVMRSKERGKGVEYALSSLPGETRAALQQQAIAHVLPVIAQEIAAPIVLQAQELTLTDKQRLERDARQGVKAAILRTMAESRCGQEAAMHTLLSNARTGRLDPITTQMLRAARDPRGRAGDGFPAIRSLKRWLSAGDLAPKVRQKDMSVPVWAKDFLAKYQQPQNPSVEDAYRQFCGETAQSNRPSIHQVRRFLAKLGTLTRERGRMGPRELKNLRPFVRRDFSELEPNDIWSGDGHTFDAEVQHPFHGRPFRPEITTFIDVSTRRVVGWSVDLAESGVAVADALRYAIERHGIPSILYTDNGSGYKNAFLQDEAAGLTGRLGITLTHSRPYNSQSRGVIERLHKTLWVAFFVGAGRGGDRAALGGLRLPAGSARDRARRLGQVGGARGDRRTPRATGDPLARRGTAEGGGMNILLEMAWAGAYQKLFLRLPAPPTPFKPGRFSGVAAARRRAQKRRNQQRARRHA
jgi:putative transposase